MREISASIRRYQATGSKLGVSWFLLLLADAHQQSGQPDQGLQAVAEALQHIEETGELYFAAEVHRKKGELLLACSGTAADAEACFLRSLDIARGQEARALELRAGMSLARLWGRQGRAGEAQRLLGGIYHSFTEGHDTADLREANQILVALGSSRSDDLGTAAQSSGPCQGVLLQG